MTIYQILCLCGIPTIILGLLTWIWNKVKNIDKKYHSVELGVQALLRNQMINDYNKWLERGYAPIYAKDSFDNMYKQYHNLGVNGVMDGIHKNFMALPTQKTNKKSE